MKKTLFVASIVCMLIIQSLFSSEEDHSKDPYEKIKKIIKDTARYPES